METPNLHAPIRALVVDDETISRRMIEFSLQQEGFECDSAKDGIEASEQLGEHSYDVVVTDLQMPRKSGFQLVQELLTIEPTPLMIVHTSLIEPRVASELIAHGVDDIVFKPVDYAAFASKVRALLLRRQTQGNCPDAADQNRLAHHPGSSSSHSQMTASERDLPDVLADLGLAEHVDRVSNYRLGRLLGVGAMGEVYEAEHKLLHRRCAIKFIRPSLVSDASVRNRFLREVRSVARISHWNHVNIFDFGMAGDGHLYYVMELLQGCTMEELVTGHGPPPPSRALHLLAQTCDGLEVAHRGGSIHRDVKPSNLMVTHCDTCSDVIKILDFGLVLETGTTPNTETVLTQVGNFCGTPAFMAPEQIMNSSDVDARADIYSLGATAYSLLTGQLPFDAISPMAVVGYHLHEEVIPPSKHNEALSPEIETIILRCMSKKPEERFQSANSLAQAIRACNVYGHWTDHDAATWWNQMAPSVLAQV